MGALMPFLTKCSTSLRITPGTLYLPGMRHPQISQARLSGKKLQVHPQTTALLLMVAGADGAVVAGLHPCLLPQDTLAMVAVTTLLVPPDLLTIKVDTAAAVAVAGM